MSTELKGAQLSVHDGIATLRMQLGRVNKIALPFIAMMEAALDATFAIPELRGVILSSAHRDFCVGADLSMLGSNTDPGQMLEFVRRLNAIHRRLESSGVPVVAVVGGVALGGGYELALACHHIAATESARLGLPEVTLGVMPGAGGTQRLPWRLGLQAGLQALVGGSTWRAPKALKLGAVDSVHADLQAATAHATQWILDNPKAKQPWDSRGRLPGGVQPGTPGSKQLFIGAAAQVYKKTAGAYPGANAVLKVVRQGLEMAKRGAFDQGVELEAQHFAALASSPQAHFMIRSLWHFKSAVERFEGLDLAPEHGVEKVGILGAGMMGAGLAFVCAKAGFQVALRDISESALVAAQAHCEKQIAKLRYLSAEQKQAISERLSFGLEVGVLAGADLLIEAVIEDMAIKHAVTREVEPLLAPDAIWASNTSALPIAELAQASAHPERFVGLHFFSPVERMALLEVVDPPACSERTLSRALAFGRALKKTCIVVNDGYGFYTSRLFASYLLEGVELLAQGYDGATIEWAAREQGMVMPPLKVFDEVSLSLGVHAFENQGRYREPVTGPGLALVQALIEQGRTGRAAGKGFYDWEQRALWPGLKELVKAQPRQATSAALGRRLMLAQCAEVGRVLDEGILRDLRHAEVGAVLGLGFAPNTGGPLSWMEAQGLPAVVAELHQLARSEGPRYLPSAALEAAAEKGGFF